MEGYDHDQRNEQILEDEKYFNEKFPPAGIWRSVIVREAAPGVLDEGGTTRRFEVLVRHENTASLSPASEDDLFVCYYDETDPEGRTRAESLLAKIYPNLSEE